MQFLVFLGIAGISVSLIMWVMARVVLSYQAADRRYLDPLPLKARLLWPLVELFDLWFGRFYRPVRLMWAQSRLELIGWTHWMQAAHLLTIEKLWAGAAALLALVFGHLLGIDSFFASLTCLACGYWVGSLWFKQWVNEQIRKRKTLSLKHLPFYMDLITLCVEAGQTLGFAIELSVKQGPTGPLRDNLSRFLRDTKAGKPRRASLDDLARRMDLDEVSAWVSTMQLAEAQGMQLGPLLRAQSESRRQERFLRAEKLAMQAPVKMIFPLVFFIFPGTFAVLLFPVGQQLLSGGLFK